MRNAKTFNAEVKVKASDLLTVINGLDSTLTKMHEELGEYDSDEYSDIENAVARLRAEIADVSLTKCLKVYLHLDAVNSNSAKVFTDLLAIGYGDDSDDLCYFPLNKLIEAELLCEELNQARGHLKGKL